MRRGRAKMADLPPLPGLSVPKQEEEEEWTPALERDPPEVNQRPSCRARNLRGGARVNYTEQKTAKDDHYLYCEECEAFFLEECERHGAPLFIPDTPVDPGVSDRARLTLPPGLEVRRSRLPGAGLGVFNCGEAVAKGTHYGPYEGEVMGKEEAIRSGYSWVIYKSSYRDNKYINAKRETHSNWMRYVNCARTEEEQNLVAFQYRGGILFRCCRLLAVGEELLVWYGQEYRYKSISFDYFWDKKSTVGERAVHQVIRIEGLKEDTPREWWDQSLKVEEDEAANEQRSATPKKGQSPAYEPSQPITEEKQPSSGGDRRKCEAGGPPVPSVVQQTLEQTFPGTEGVMSELSQTRVFPCSECPFSFTSQIFLHKHIKRSHDDLYISLLRNREIRPETLSSPSLHITTSNTHVTPAHAWRQRDMDAATLYHCDRCGKSFRQVCNLRKHQLIHKGEKPYHCDQCGKNFTDSGALKRHQRVHTGQKPYHCDQCGKCFRQISHLRIHQYVHTGERPYHCDLCGQNFATSGVLSKHKRVHTGERRYNCAQCGKNFTRSGTLKRHQRVHTEEKPFNCDQCGKNFRERSKFKTHQYVHTGEKPYHCDLCGRNFAESVALKRHQYCHTGEKPYNCAQCGKNFTLSGNLKRHQRIHSGQKP